MANNFPWFKFYATDWITDEKVLFLDYFERGVYLDLLVRQWVEGSIPSEPSKCLALLKQGLSSDLPNEKERLNQSLRKVLELFEEHPNKPDRLVHPKLEEQRSQMLELSEIRAKAGKKGGKRTHEKRDNQMQSKCKANEKQSSSDKESESESDILNKNKNRAREPFAESPSLDEAKRFAEIQSIPMAFVEKWHATAELNEWSFMANGKTWSKNLLAYWKSVPPSDQRKWRDQATAKTQPSKQPVWMELTKNANYDREL